MDKQTLESESGRRLVAIEIGRGFAAIFVVLFHFNIIIFSYFGAFPWLGVSFYGGHAGVEYFFVLSGFIIYYIHSRDIGQSNRIIDFYKKRIIRIIPMYWLTISIMLTAFILHRSWGEEKSLDISKIVRDYFLIMRPGPLILPPSWTLEREALFYIIFGLCILRRNVGVGVFLLWQALTLFFSFFSYCYDTHLNYGLWYFFGIHNFGFLVGVCCAWIYLNWPDPSDWLRRLILAAGITLVFAVMFIEAHQSLDSAASQDASREVAGSACYTFSFGMIIYACVWSKQNYSNKLFSLLTLFGASSYVIYLMHEPIASLLLKILASNALRGYVEANFAYAMTVIAAIILSIIVHLFVEKPISRYLRKKFIPRPTRAGAKMESAVTIDPTSIKRQVAQE
jgi:exopolysaccharide production protein ExoZ